ncbi:MAG: hypothetical protein OEZ68_15265 [Gammaproteobacteria bacterium]|nr:hypothetical protein [Gammaproteobacteria bacterium]MDH5802160.1 hypothetical protein [Gammaproteobacteria bacterium]
MKNNSKFILSALILFSVVMGVYELVLFSKEMEVSRSLSFIWAFVFLVFVALWVSEDSKAFPEIYRPFDYGYLVFLFYILYLPYYLVKTRGIMKGVAMLLGFIFLFNFALLLQWPIFWLS